MQPKSTDDRELQRLLRSMDAQNPAPDSAPIDLSRWKKWIWLLLVIGLAALGWHWFGGGDEQKLRRTFSQLGGAVSKGTGAVANLSILGTMDDLDKLFADSVSVQFSGDEDYGFTGHYSLAEIKSKLASVRMICKSLNVSFSDIRIRSRNSATATVDATVRAVATVEGGKVEEVRLLSCRQVKKNGNWCFESFVERQILDKGKSQAP